MLKPVPIVVDGNLQLNAISSAILGTMDPKDIIFNSKNPNVMYRGRGMVVKTFINTLFKTVLDVSKKGYNPTHLCVVWDRKLNGKYHKTSILDSLNDGTTYKSDRSFLTKEDLLDNSLSKEERLKLEAKLVIDNEFLESRSFLQNKLPKYGIGSFSSPGWEADDIDYIWGLETNKRQGVHIHCSGDSDWGFHLTGKDVHWQFVRGKLFVKTEQDIRDKNKIPKGMSLMEWASINMAALGSHNNLLRTIDPNIKRFTKKYRDKLFSGDLSIIDNMPRYLAQKKTFDINGFSGISTVKSMYDEMLNTSLNSDEAEFLELLIELHVNDRDKNTIKSNYSETKSTLLNSKILQLV